MFSADRKFQPTPKVLLGMILSSAVVQYLTGAEELWFSKGIIAVRRCAECRLEREIIGASNAPGGSMPTSRESCSEIRSTMH